MKVWLCCLVFLVLSVVPLSAQSTPHLEGNPCPFYIPYENETEGKTLSCATLTVLEDHSQPDGTTIQLAVMILRSTSDQPRPDPVLYLAGGPGGAALTAYDEFLKSAFRADRDIVLLDQRGTGYSHPSLNCWEYWYNNDDPSSKCLARLKNEGITLEAYHSAQSAQDVADLISVLGYDEVNLWGISYGTRLALTTLRDTHAAIRSIIIDGVYPPEVLGWEENPVNGYRAFKVLFDACAADETCNEAYPNLEEVFQETVDALDDEPMTLQNEDGDEIDDTLTGQQFVKQIYKDLYDSTMIRYLPAKIYAAYNYDAYNVTYVGWDVDEPENPLHQPGVDLKTVSEDNYYRMWADYLGYDSPEALHKFLDSLSEKKLASERTSFEARAKDSNGALIDDDSDGFYNTVECYEEIPFNSLTGAQALVDDLPEGVQKALLMTYTNQAADCDIWKLPASPAFENEAVVSDIPVLVVSGEYDPVTPPAWGQSAADALPHSTHIIVPGMGHGSVDAGQACPTDIALVFLDDPTATLDVSCIDEMAPIEFYVSEN